MILSREELPRHQPDENILSLSHVYNIQHSACASPATNIEITLPVPDDYTGEGNIVVLSRPSTAFSMEESESDDELWNMTESEINPDRSSISFRTSSLGQVVPLEIPADADRDEVRSQAVRTLSKRKECHVTFFIVGKYVGFKAFDLVVECVQSNRKTSRIEEWKNEGFNTLRVSGDFSSKYNQRFRLKLKSNLNCSHSSSELHLEVLPGLNSHQSLITTYSDHVTHLTGELNSIEFYKVDNDSVEWFTTLPFMLKDLLPRPVSSGNRCSDFLLMTFPPAEDRRSPVVSLNRTAEECGRQRTLSIDSVTPEDGTPVSTTVTLEDSGLVTMAGRTPVTFEDTATHVTLSDSGMFTLEDSDPVPLEHSSPDNGHTNEEADRNLSDRVSSPGTNDQKYNRFILRLIRKLPPDVNLFIALGLDSNTIERIRIDTANSNMAYTMYVMMTQCQNELGDKAKFFKLLLITLEVFEQNEVKEWVTHQLLQWQSSGFWDEQTTTTMAEVIQGFA